MRKILLLIMMITSVTLFSQNSWELVWKLEQKPFMEPQVGSEMAIVKAGFDTDQDGWGEFLCAWTDLTTNYLLMYEASGDNQYELVWSFLFPVATNTFAGIAVGDIDNNGYPEILTTLPAVANPETPNPTRLWVFEWNRVVGENKYGTYDGTGGFVPTAEWNFDVPDNIDFRPYSLLVENIDNDEKNELIMGVRQSTRGREIIVASVEGEFNGFGTWEMEYNFAQAFGGSLYSVTTGDLDSDGKKEIYALIWNYLTLRIFENDGNGVFNIVTELDEISKDSNIDYGAVDAVRVADVNNDGVMEWYMAGTEPDNTIFIMTDISDVSQITAQDIKPLLSIPGVNVAKLRTLYIADPDHDGNLSLMIAGEGNGKIFDVEYKGEGDPASADSWDVNTIFSVWEYGNLDPTAQGTITPRFFYGHPAADMDKDGKDEFVFINYSTDFDVWAEDAYVWVLEIDAVTDIHSDESLIPTGFELSQNYPNPFNPSTTIKFGLPEQTFVQLDVYNLLGEKVATLVNGELNAGTHFVEFNAEELSSGTYIYTLKTDKFSSSKKLLLVK